MTTNYCNVNTNTYNYYCKSQSHYLLADVPKAFDIFGFGLASLLSGLLSAKEEPRPRPVPLEPAPDDMTLRQNIHVLLITYKFVQIISLTALDNRYYKSKNCRK